MRKLTTQEFIDRARAVHGDKYDYAFSVYKSARENVLIYCQKHGVFEQRPNDHLSGKGCRKCSTLMNGENKKSNTKEFTEKARVVHGNKYDYSFVLYTRSKDAVHIICQQHGVFKQMPNHHLNGAGCPTCKRIAISLKKRSSITDFIGKAKLIHGNRYDYSFSVYQNSQIKVYIRCTEHGIFEQTPNDHLSGAGCPTCAKSGFDRTKNGFLYVLRSDCGRYMKIGITHDPKQRYSYLSKATPFSFKRIELVESTGYHIANLEKELLAEYQQAEFTETFNGYSEWRLWDDSIRHKLISFMNKGDLNGPL